MNSRIIPSSIALSSALLACGLISPSMTHAQTSTGSRAEPEARFAARGELLVVEHSADGRFGLSGKAQFQPVARELGGRFALATGATPSAVCGPQSPAIFANGFEN
jgi:hypothetical protein